jgi:excisionase family DNA binding protein
MQAASERAAEIVMANAEEAAGYLDVERAAEYLSTTPAAVRALVRRRQVPHHRTPNGRLLFDRRELDAWVRQSDGLEDAA